MSKSALALGTAVLALVAGSAQAATELRFTCYEDGNECEMMRSQLQAFEAQNPDIKVTIDKVAYKAILESLPVQLAAGEGPGRIYVVEPTGPVFDDPNLTDKKFPGNPTLSYRSREPLRVIGEVTGWQPHAPEQVRAMRDGLARLSAEGNAHIID